MRMVTENGIFCFYTCSSTPAGGAHAFNVFSVKQLLRSLVDHPSDFPDGEGVPLYALLYLWLACILTLSSRYGHTYPNAYK